MLHFVRVDSDRESMTIGALNAIKNSNIIIGYEKNLIMIEDITKGKIIHEEAINDKIPLIELGISMALDNEVVLIDYEDPETFGLANLFFQNLGKYDEINFKIYPSTTSINYDASLLGAPLTDFVAIDLSEDLITTSEIKKKIECGLKSNFVIVIYKGKKYFSLIKEILLNFKKEDLWIGLVSNGKHDIVKIENITENSFNSNTILIIGNRMTYVKDDRLITPKSMIITPFLHPLTKEFYTNFINNESPEGSNKTCEYYSCHGMVNQQQCDFCFCPFYPCGDGSTGGKWIKNKNVWDCVDCTWIHEKYVVDFIKPKIKEIIEDVDDLKTKMKDLLKIRRECILNSDND